MSSAVPGLALLAFAVQWHPVLPPVVVAVIGFLLLALLAFGCSLLLQKHVPPRSVAVLATLRVVMVALFCTGLLRPVLSFPRSETQSPDVLVLVDASRSMNHASAAGNGSRLDEALQILRDSPAIESAARRYTLHWFTFDRRAAATSLAELDAASQQRDGTDFAASLTSAMNHARLLSAASGTAGQPTRVLLVSDGQDQGAISAITTARELGLSVDVLALASDASAAESNTATIDDVQSPRRVLLGSECAFQVSFGGIDGEEGLSLVLEENGRAVQRQEVGGLLAEPDAGFVRNPTGEPGGVSPRTDIQPRNARGLTPSGSPESRARGSHFDHLQHRVLVTHRPAEAGLKRYTLQLKRGDVAIGSPYAVNVQVSDGRHDVLVLEDTWRWEFKYLRRILEDDPSFSFTAFLSRGERAFVQFGEPDRRVRLGGFPHSRAELEGFDTLILGDGNPASWPKGLARNLSSAVSDAGKSLIVVAGSRLGTWVEVAELARLLPVELTPESGSPLTGQIAVRATPEGIGQAWFALTPTQSPIRTGAQPSGLSVGRPSQADADGLERPSYLPAIQQLYPVLRKRPAATVLLETVDQANGHGPLVVVAEHTVGRGRVLFIATDTLWRWQSLGPRNDAGVTLHAAFWQHALRALAPPEPSSSAERLWLRPDQSRYRTGDRVRLTAEWESATDSSPSSLAATVVLPDGRRLPLDMPRDNRDPRRFTAWFDVIESGRYRIEAAARGESETSVETATMLEVAPSRHEDDAAQVDTAALVRLAESTGGRLIDPTRPDGWIPPNAAPPATVVRQQSFDLWHNFTIVLLVCGVLAVDWLLRLFRGYV